MKNLFKWLFSNNREHIKTACEIVELLKRVVESDSVARIVDIIPGRFDNKMLEVLKIATTKALRTLHIANGIHPLQSSLKTLRTSKNKPQYYRAIAGEIIADLTKLPIDKAILEGANFYDANKKFINSIKN